MRPWDDGIRWRCDVVEAPTIESVALEVVRDQHLRVTNGTAEDDYLARLIRVTRRQGELATRRAWVPQGCEWVGSGFPRGPIRLPRPPCLEVEQVRYVDETGVERVWGGSPLPYQVSLPIGPKAGPAWLAPRPGERWPDTQAGALDAVVVVFRAGYSLVSASPPVLDLPDELVQGQLLMIGELYKQRSESVHAVHNTPAYRTATRFWRDYRVY